MTARIACSPPPDIPRLLTSLLACLLFLGVLLLTGCAPRMKADVQAVSAPGFRKAGQSYVLVPGTALSTMNAINADMFRQSTQRLRAVLTGHGYREVPSPETADMAVVVEWKVDGPHEVPDTSYSSRPSVGIGIGYGSWPWYGGAYGSRYGGWGYGGYRGFGTGYGYPPPMTVVHTRTLSIEARDLRAGRATAPETPSSAQAGQEEPGQGVTGMTGMTGMTEQGMAAKDVAGRKTPGSTAEPAGDAAPTVKSSGPPPAEPGPKTSGPKTSGPDVPEYARPPYGTPIGTVEGLPSPTELTGPVLWKVVVTSTGSSRDIQGALPALTVAASRWIGITANVKVAVDDEFNVTIQGQ
uniref:Lipoprotein n=1 Tax=Nitratidesulfovibrio vulgaris (strain DSM 19637 / Miyazaki F) TaxID=883 RepID=B8DK82_NITV9